MLFWKVQKNQLSVYARFNCYMKINERVLKWIGPFLACWCVGWWSPWLRDCLQSFIFALEASLLGQIFIFRTTFSRGHYQPTYQPPQGVYLLIVSLLPAIISGKCSWATWDLISSVQSNVNLNMWLSWIFSCSCMCHMQFQYFEYSTLLDELLLHVVRFFLLFQRPTLHLIIFSSSECGCFIDFLQILKHCMFLENYPYFHETRQLN